MRIGLIVALLLVGVPARAEWQDVPAPAHWQGHAACVATNRGREPFLVWLAWQGGPHVMAELAPGESRAIATTRPAPCRVSWDGTYGGVEVAVVGRRTAVVALRDAYRSMDLTRRMRRVRPDGDKSLTTKIRALQKRRETRQGGG